ncbi:MAG: hypothetical protein ABIK92_07830 [Pseudomonadota bacterium]
MKLVIIFAICIFVLCWHSQPYDENSSELVSGKPCSIDASVFKKLKKGMSTQEVFLLVGKPTRHAGSGIAYDVYQLNNETSVWIAWLKGKTTWAFFRKLNGEKEMIFE